MTTCTSCDEPFTTDDPPYVFQPTGKLYHRLCLADPVQALAELEELPRWQRALVRMIAWFRR